LTGDLCPVDERSNALISDIVGVANIFNRREHRLHQGANLLVALEVREW
jgi:hypothetical protein